MGLTKIKIGDVITVINKRNQENRDLPFYGINKEKEFMPTVADTHNLDKSKYKIMTQGRFVFSGMQTGRDMCIRIGLYNLEQDALVSPAYTTFEVSSSKILPEYLFMVFNSPEKDRYGAFLSDGSVRANLDWDVFCDIELEFPDVFIQKKYVDIYSQSKHMITLLKRENEQLKRVLQFIMIKYKIKQISKSLGDLIQPIDDRNKNNFDYPFYGLNKDKEFMETKASTNSLDRKKYKIVIKNRFVFSGMQTGRDHCIRIGLSLKERPILVSPAYTTFEIKHKNVILPEYLYLYFLNPEMDRLGWFLSDGSVRSNLDWDRFLDILIPVPSIDVQKNIVRLFTEYYHKKGLIQKMKAIQQRICPILIKGAMEEGSR